MASKSSLAKKIKKRVDYLYPEKASFSGDLFDSLKKKMDDYSTSEMICKIDSERKAKSRFTEEDAILITYGDSIKERGKLPLYTLRRFLKKHVKNSISGVHILPFFPYSSDDGFSIIDYKKVDPKLGSWKDIKKLAGDYRIMADLVINHISSKSAWFKGFLEGDEKYSDYFISFDKKPDTSSVFRPRTHPLLTKFDTTKGKKYVWTTFSADQIDLNFSNPEVFLEMVDVMLFYLSQGIQIIRLDAVGFLWKKLGTSCFHLKKTHEVVKLLRDIAEYVAPYSAIITETNVPYKDNISYFGEGDEAHMVYQFSFPPLVLDAVLRADTSYLNNLYSKLSQLPGDRLFFNFLASHDGIGVLSAKNVLSKEEQDNLLKKVKRHNGYISYKSLSDGSKTPYELNINYYDAVNGKEDELAVDRFMATQAVSVFSKGVPGIYIHSLLGSRNWNKGVEQTSIKRKINREKLSFVKLEKELGSDGRRRKVLEQFIRMLEIRKSSPDFSPYAPEKVIDSDSRVLGLRRGKHEVVINFSSDEVEYKPNLCDEDAVVKIMPYEVMIVE